MDVPRTTILCKHGRCMPAAVRSTAPLRALPVDAVNLLDYSAGLDTAATTPAGSPTRQRYYITFWIDVVVRRARRRYVRMLVRRAGQLRTALHLCH